MRFMGTDKAKLVKISLPQGIQSNRVMSRLATMSGILYHSEKWGRRNNTYAGSMGTHYIHEFKGGPKGHVMFIPSKSNNEHGYLLAWKRCKVTEAGIED
jgi:hypothetical protein